MKHQKLMAVDITNADHEEVFSMVSKGELTLEQFKVWLDDVLVQEHDNGYQNGYDDGASEG